MVVLMADDTEANRDEVWSIVGRGEDVRFEQATYSYAYLSGILERLAAGMNDGSLSYVLGAALDDTENRVQIFVSSAGDEQLLALGALDTAGGGTALDIYLVEPSEKLPSTDDLLSASPDDSVTADLVTVSTAPGGQRLVFSLTNHADCRYTYGDQPFLDVETDGVWTPVSLRENVGWHEIGRLLPPGESVEITVSLTILYGDLPVGHYRFYKALTDEDTGETITVPVEFTIE